MRVSLPLAEMLDRAGCGALVLDHRGEVRSINAQARTLLAAEAGAPLDADPGHTDPGDSDPKHADAVRVLLARGRERLSLTADAWTFVPRQGRRPLLLHAMPVPSSGGDGEGVVLLLIDLDRQPRPNRSALEQVFGLTPAEARLTALLTAGTSPAEAAAAQGVTLATIRKQLASIFGKTRSRGQVELVALAARLAGLP